MDSDYSGLKRKIHAIPDYIKQALDGRGLMNEYKKRPAYQQNDYVGWIERAKRVETRLIRLNQMLDELEAGGIYMNMVHPPSMKNR